MDDGPAPAEEDFSSLPLGERLSHKNWKARVHGYEALIKAFAASGSDSDPVFKQYINNPDILKKMVTDSNVVAQEKGVEAVLNFVNFAGEAAARFVFDISARICRPKIHSQDARDCHACGGRQMHGLNTVGHETKGLGSCCFICRSREWRGRCCRKFPTNLSQADLILTSMVSGISSQGWLPNNPKSSQAPSPHSKK